MRGKLGLIAGLATGYVLGTRAGRERYEQISRAASKLWHTEPVQKQVTKAKSFAKSSALALPSALWDTVVKVTKAGSGKGTAGHKLDSAIAEAKKAAPDVSKAAEESAEALTDAVENATAKKPAAKTTRTTKKD